MDFDCFNCDVSRVISQYPDFLHYSMKLAYLEIGSSILSMCHAAERFVEKRSFLMKLKPQKRKNCEM